MEGINFIEMDEGEVSNIDTMSELMELDEDDESIADVSEDVNNSEVNYKVDEIRKATKEYLAGVMSLKMFAAAMGEPLDQASDDSGESGTEDAEELPPKKKKFNDTASEDDNISDFQKFLGRETDHSEVPERGGFTTRRRRKMSPTLQNMLGEANLRYARGDLQGSIDICNEVIREQPTFVEPYRTLALAHEGLEMLDKALQFSLIAAFLNPKACEEWTSLAEKSLEQESYRQALVCLNKALLSEQGNIELELRKAFCYEKLLNTRMAVKTYERILNLRPKDGAVAVSVLASLARLAASEEKTEEALQHLLRAFKEYPKHVSSKEINLVCETALTLKRPTESLLILSHFTPLRFVPPIEESCFESEERVIEALHHPNLQLIVPSALPIDIAGKVAATLIGLGASDLARDVVDRIMTTKVESHGDIHLDVAEAYMGAKRYSEAVDVLIPLTKSESYGVALTWLRLSESLYFSDRLEEAAAGFERVVSLAPQQSGAKLNLSIVLQKLGRSDAALRTLEQVEEEPLDGELLLQRSLLLLKRGLLPQFYSSVLSLFGRHAPYIRSIEDTKAVFSTGVMEKRISVVESERVRRGEESRDPRTDRWVDKAADAEGEWDVYLRLAHSLMNAQRSDLLSRLIYTVCGSKLFATLPGAEKELRGQALYAALNNNDVHVVPLLVRNAMSSIPKSTAVLNLFAIAAGRVESNRYGKQIFRLLRRYPNHPGLSLLAAHLSFTSGTYKYALMDYAVLEPKQPDNPIIPLMLAITLLHILSQKTTVARGQVAVHALGFFRRYATLRGDENETNYNMGRALHFLGLLPLAKKYYEKCLTGELGREAAFNLARIYIESGRPGEARKILRAHLVI